MPSYKAPLDDMRFVLNEVLRVRDELADIKEFEALDDSTLNQFLTEIAKLSEDVLTPLNKTGDTEGCVYDRDTKSVKTPNGFKEAYEQFCAAGLTSLTCDPAYGGMGMPFVLNTALSEMFCSANISFAMYPGLSHGAYNALHEYGSDELKQAYLPKLVSGEWSGTMCLTEPHCGTDLGLIKTKAVKQGDGSYAISGTKIFISAGEHDLTSNILHLVLAKIEDASTPAGVKGISLFIVPKFLPDAAGNAGERNAVACGRIEEKMGIHGNSTCEMNFEGAKGWLVGEAHKGMKAMFVMMNEARLGVGLQGLGLSEVAFQNALIYALDRKQGQPIDQKMSDENLAKPPVAIIQHPEVRRELLTIKSAAEGGRMLAYWAALQLDLSQKHPYEGKRKHAKALLDLLTPIMKAHFTDNAVDNTNSAMQIFGGHGYIREHGVEQFNRDARITRIYEGTNGVQALDLVFRKALKENLMSIYFMQLIDDIKSAKKNGVSLCLLLSFIKAVFRLWKATQRLRLKGLWAKMTGGMSGYMQDAAGGATDYLKLASYVAMGHMWLKMAETATVRLKQNPANKTFYETKLKTAAFYMKHVLPQSRVHYKLSKRGARHLLSISDDALAHEQTGVGETTPA